MNTYVQNLEKNFIEFKDEIEELAVLRKNEQRLNAFMNNLNDYREKNIQIKKILSSHVKIKDSKFNFQTSQLNDKVSNKQLSAVSLNSSLNN